MEKVGACHGDGKCHVVAKSVELLPGSGLERNELNSPSGGGGGLVLIAMASTKLYNGLKKRKRL